jgi:hypothetical protein
MASRVISRTRSWRVHNPSTVRIQQRSHSGPLYKNTKGEDPAAPPETAQSTAPEPVQSTPPPPNAHVSVTDYLIGVSVLIRVAPVLQVVRIPGAEGRSGIPFDIPSHLLVMVET